MRSLALAISVIKQAVKSKRDLCTVKNTKVILKFLTAICQLGYIRGFTVLGSRRIIVRISYHKNKPILRGLSLYSKSSHRVYHR
jgi:ribosomal protein S8